MEFETLGELVGKKLRINFEIKEGEDLPKKLCAKTYAQYEFYYMKDPNEQNEDDEDDEHFADEDEEDRANNRSKKLKKVFQTKTVDQKTVAPSWDYKFSHLLDIDEDLLMKLQTDSITVAVYGMQDGREKFAKLKGILPTNKPAEMKPGIQQPADATLGSNTVVANKDDEELDQLRQENLKLMKMLEQSKTGKDEGMCTVTCNIF